MKRFLLAVLVVGGLALLALWATGAVHVGSTDDMLNISIDKKELGQKAEEGLEKASDAGTVILQKTGDVLGKASEKLRGSLDRTKEGKGVVKYELPLDSSPDRTLDVRTGE